MKIQIYKHINHDVFLLIITIISLKSVNKEIF